MFIAGVFINEIYSAVSMNSGFFTFGVLEKGLIFALIYLSYIWIFTRQHELLALIGAGGIVFIIMSLSPCSLEVDNANWNWSKTILFIFCIVSAAIANYQGEKLLEEDDEKIKSDQRALIREEIENAKREEH